MLEVEEDMVEAKVNTLPPCDFHDGCTAQYDFKTQMGPWANGCQAAFDENGGKLGTGRGQKLILNGR